jgi:hypothetical protein
LRQAFSNRVFEMAKSPALLQAPGSLFLIEFLVGAGQVDDDLADHPARG